MPDFDPFSEKEKFKPATAQSKSKDSKKLIFKIIMIIAVLALVGLAVYYLFFNTVEIEFTVKNTENQFVDATIKLTKEGSDKEITVNPGDVIKLKKGGNYRYKVSAKDYSSKVNQTLDSSKDDIVNVVLDKDIKLSIVSFTCPEKVYLGQTVSCEITAENTSSSEDYNTDYFVFSGLDDFDDFKNKTYKFVDQYGEELSPTRKTIYPARSTSVLVSFRVPNDKKHLGTKNLSIRVKYKSTKEESGFEVVNAPVINFSSEIANAGKMVSGEEKRFKYVVDNTKNNTSVSDLQLYIDANYITDIDYNLDLQNVIKTDKLTVWVDAKDRTEGQITVKLPADARAGRIEGNLVLSGVVLPEPKTLHFTISIEEPENKFLLSLSKTAETLSYDSNTGSTDEKLVTIKVDNQNAIKVRINSIAIVDLMDNNCINWIAVTNAYDNYDIQPKDETDIPVIIKGKSLSGLSVVTGTKLCAIKVSYQNPFTEANIEKILNLTITVG